MTGLNSIFVGSFFTSAFVVDAGNANVDVFYSVPNGLNPNYIAVVGAAAALASFFLESNPFFGESSGVLIAWLENEEPVPCFFRASAFFF